MIDKKLLFGGIAGAVIIIGILVVFPFVGLENSEESFSISEANFENNIMMTNGEKHLVPLDKIKSGGPPKDGIPPIDNPKFVSASEEQFVPDDELIIGLRLDGETKAYPLFIMVWHEIVNDKLGDTPVAITYCPLCFTTQVFDRTLNGQEVEFGTSGKLYNSNLVMYDRLTDSYWSQALGLAIKGELTGMELQRIPFDVMKWKDWKSLYPDSLVLTTETGHIRAYGVDPYGSYYTDSRIIFPVENYDDRMHEKEIILGFDLNDAFKAYRLADIANSKVINDEINGQSILLTSQFSENARAFDREVDGQILEFTFSSGKITDTNTNSEWNYEGMAIDGPLAGKQLDRIVFDPGFWFEWVAFHHSTSVYGEEN